MNDRMCGFEHRVLVEEERVWLAARAALVARHAGFDASVQSRVALCVAELVSNAVRHAGGGLLRVTIRSFAPPTIVVEMLDSGPGIPSYEKAVLDGYSRGRFIAPDDPPHARRGLGTGLGAVARTSSELRVVRRDSGGTRVEAGFRACGDVRWVGHERK